MYLKKLHISNFRCFRDYTIEFAPGVTVLFGKNGSGKSTLASLVNGLVPFSYTGDIEGEYYIKGQNPKDLGIFGLSKFVGTVLQDTDGQFIGLTVAEDVAFSLENDCISPEEMYKKVDEVAELVDIKDLLKASPLALSGGQKQRVSMAGVMVDDVDILLFDEPLANLDPATGKRAIALIDDIKKTKDKTILIIEHRLEDALYRDVDRIILIGDGTVIADMSPADLLCSDVLKEHGIREPLYITALKHAGCELKADKSVAHIDTLDVSSYKDKVKSWFESTDIEKEVREEKELLKIEGLSFSYDESKKILDDINLTVHQGEMMAIVGKNGAGKTTLSNLICGFLTPNEGTISLNGQDMAQLSIKERGEHIGVVMQNPNQMISKAMIFDEVALGLQVRGVPEDEIKERVNETLKICGLYQFRNWPVSALSFGQKKRVTIASILVMNPEIIILDEPTAGQDYHHYTEIMEFLKTIHELKGITIIMITHDMHLMLEYTDRAVVIADGQMLADDTPAAILTNEELSDKAYLKKTSLYDLAVACDIEDPSQFVEHFISFERRKHHG